MKKIDIKKTKYFDEWFDALTQKEQLQVMARLERIVSYGHFGDAKSLGEGLCELRWKNGWRVYFIMAKDTLILLIGGHKNEQNKNIKKARINIEYYTESQHK